MKRLSVFVFGLMLVQALFAAEPVKTTLRSESSHFGENLLDSKFSAYKEGFTQEGETILCDNGGDTAVHRGACRGVTLNQTVANPIFVSAESKAENVSGTSDVDYSVYVDLIYQDGSTLWGQSRRFSTGTHDWEKKEFFIFPAKPVKSLTFYVLLRNHSGKAAFRNFRLCEVESESKNGLFDLIPMDQFTAGAQNRVSYQLRDVAASSDIFSLGDETNDSKQSSLGITLSQTVEPMENGRLLTLELTSDSDADRAITFYGVYPIPGENRVWLDSPTRSTPIEPGREYFNGGTFQVGSNGRLSLWPFGAVTYDNAGKQAGTLLGIAPDYPAFYRAFFNDVTGELALAFDLALTKEKPTATLQLVVAHFDARDEFGAALAAYYSIFPNAFVCRTPSQGNWMPFAPISKVPGWEDFGFKFKEGSDEIAWDDEHGIITFRYTEPMTWWMTMDQGTPRTYEAALEQANQLAKKGNQAAQALITSGHYDQSGKLAAILLNTPWCDGAVWSINDMPGLDQGIAERAVHGSDEFPISGFALKWSQKIANDQYGEPVSDLFGKVAPCERSDAFTAMNDSIRQAFADSAPKTGLDGEYIDSSEGYVTAMLDFRRDHFAWADRPLTFEQDTQQPGILRGLIAYEYAKKISDDTHNRSHLMMANSTPGQFFWLVPLLDVIGTETDWNRGGWAPMSVNDLFYRRALCYKKPYCFLMNSDFTKFSFETTEKFMRRALAFGMFPGFFSADASTAHYFKNPDLFERDRPLFKKYLPLIRQVAEAGWEPIPLAAASGHNLIVQRFGTDSSNLFLTVYNDSDLPQTVRLTLDARLNVLTDKSQWTDALTGETIAFENGSAEITLEAWGVAVLK